MDYWTNLSQNKQHLRKGTSKNEKLLGTTKNEELFENLSENVSISTL